MRRARVGGRKAPIVVICLWREAEGSLVGIPVTAKLSRRFYDAFGDDLTNELVEWFNAVDLTYRTELRELNEVNFVRSDAKLAEGLAGVRSEFKQGIAGVRMATEALESRLRVELAVQKADTVKWMFLFWLGTIAVSVANRFF